MKIINSKTLDNQIVSNFIFENNLIIKSNVDLDDLFSKINNESIKNVFILEINNRLGDYVEKISKKINNIKIYAPSFKEVLMESSQKEKLNNNKVYFLNENDVVEEDIEIIDDGGIRTIHSYSMFFRKSKTIITTLLEVKENWLFEQKNLTNKEDERRTISKLFIKNANEIYSTYGGKLNNDVRQSFLKLLTSF